MCDYDRIYKFKNRYIIYSIKKRIDRPLVFVFSGVDSVSSFNRMSYYSLRDKIDATVVHIMDNFGSHGCYLLSISRDQKIRDAVIGLIRSIQVEIGLSNGDTYFVGTSKGATSAIAYSLMVGGGCVICGEPQVMLGDFIYNKSWQTYEQSRALAYSITGRVNPEDKEMLNRLLLDIVVRYGPSWRGVANIHYGIGSGYFEKHICYLQNILSSSQLRLISHDFDEHNDIIPIFQNELEHTFGVLSDVSMEDVSCNVF